MVRIPGLEKEGRMRLMLPEVDHDCNAHCFLLLVFEIFLVAPRRYSRSDCSRA